MSYLVLARKYRPQTFGEVVGQEHVVRTLSNAIETGRIAHAFLFVGPRGIGKTSTARILAKALNCTDGPKIDFDPDEELCVEIAEGRSLDVIEIDGASNNGVEQVRDLRDNVQYAPARGRYKVYIIDEVHMLSTAAFNALLKTLEEPPAHVKFIFATTEVHKVPATILSRCQRFDLKRIPDEAIAGHLKMIAEKEGISIDDEALRLLARNAEGGLRDAESSMDQLISFCGSDINEADALQVFGLTGYREVWDLAEAIQAGIAEEAIKRVRELVRSGKDLSQLTRELVRYFRNLLLYMVSPDLAKTELMATEVQHFENVKPLPERDLILAFIEELVRLEEKIRYALVKDVLFEITVLRLVEQKKKVNLEAIIRRLALAEGGPSEGTVPSAPVAQPVSVPKREPAPAPDKTPEPPRPEPVQKEAPVRTPVVDGPQVWEAAANGFRAQRPMLALSMDCCTYKGYENGVLTVRLEADPGTHQNLQQPRNLGLLEKLAKDAASGQAVKVVFDFIERKPEPEPAAPAAKEESKEQEEPAVEEPPYPSMDKAEFENDEKIQAALKAFDARLVSLKP